MQVLVRSLLAGMIFFILVFPVSSYSQITIEDTDIPSTVGTELIYFDTFLGTPVTFPFDVETTEPDHYWDFSQADTITGRYATDTYLDPSLSPLPDINLLVKSEIEFMPGLSVVRKSHYNLSSTSMLLMAYELYAEPAMFDSLFFPADPEWLGYQLPVNYQSNCTSTSYLYQFTNGIPTDTTYNKTDFVIDGWGQVLTLYQLYDCLRLKTLQYDWDDIQGWVDPDTGYYWVANDIGAVFEVPTYYTEQGQKLET